MLRALCEGGVLRPALHDEWAQYNGTVHGTGNRYDAAGNVLNDGANKYLYDPEGRLCAVENLTTTMASGYVYGADGGRVAKGSISSWTCNVTSNSFAPTSVYELGLGNEQLSEAGVSGSTKTWRHTNVWAGAGLLATYAANTAGAPDTYFALTDWLGTKRAEISPDNTLTGFSSLPYGNDLSSDGSAPDATEHHFTGKERDTESGNDYFGARYYESSMGRWLSPDWSAGVVPVPYATLSNPQSLNLYSYVRNNPLNSIDAGGHLDCSAFDGNTSACMEVAALGDSAPADGSFVPYSSAQQQNGSSKGSGFWHWLGHGLSNWAHGNSWNYIKATVTTTETYSLRPAEPNLTVTVTANAVSVIGAATHNGMVGAAGAALGLANHPDPAELGLIGMSLVPGVDETGAALGAVYDGGMLVGKGITNNVMAPMLNAIPGPTIGVTGDGQEVQAPDLSDPQTWGAN